MGTLPAECDIQFARWSTSSVDFNAGWYVVSKSTQSPDGLEIALDKSSYKAGDVAKLKISPRFAGELLIAIGTDTITKTMSVSLPASGSTIDIPVEKKLGRRCLCSGNALSTGQRRKITPAHACNWCENGCQSTLKHALCLFLWTCRNNRSPLSNSPFLFTWPVFNRAKKPG